jgi:hypothetical protein
LVATIVVAAIVSILVVFVVDIVVVIINSIVIVVIVVPFNSFTPMVTDMRPPLITSFVLGK